MFTQFRLLCVVITFLSVESRTHQGNPLAACATLHTLDLPGHLDVPSVNSNVAGLPSHERLLLYSTLGAQPHTKSAQQIFCKISDL